MKKEYITPELEILDLRVEGRILQNISAVNPDDPNIGGTGGNNEDFEGEHYEP